MKKNAGILIALVSVAIVGLATVSVRNNAFARNNSLANKYAQEAIEWLRSERDKGWVAFSSHTHENENISCLTEIGEWQGACEEGDTIPETNIKREFSLIKKSDPNRVTANVYMSWIDGVGDHKIKVVTDFTDWSTVR